MKKNSVLIGGFFVLLFFGLFLGDGKQWAIDVYGATLAIIIAIYSGFTHGSTARKMPKGIVVAWIAVAVSTVCSTILSDSPGYSFSWIIRLISGFLLYKAFYNISANETHKTFAQALVVFVCASAIVFVSASALPLFGFLPSMNLLGVGYGHSHFADLLVMIAPVLFGYVWTTNSLMRLVVSLVYIAILYATRARGAVLLVCAYTVTALYRALGTSRRHSLVIALSAGLLCAYVVISTVAMFLPDASLGRYIKKDPIVNRIVYWQQATDAFIERPVFGGGPGTFSLSSLQKQRTPWVSSWFAHSAPIQLLAEMGAFGFLVFGWLAVEHVRALRRQKTQQETWFYRALSASVALLLLYSCFEYVLDYFVVWMLFWATLGLLVGSGAPRVSHEKDWVRRFLVGVLVVFYALWISSFIVTLTIKRYDIAFYLAPFDSMQALMFLDVKSMYQPKERDIKIINAFHKKNPTILFEISKLKERQGDDARALLYAKLASYARPQNSEYYTWYFSLLAKMDKHELLGNEMLDLSKAALPRDFHAQIDELIPYARGFGEYYKDWMIPEKATFRNGYASLYYRLGIADLRDVEPTERLLLLARDIYPDLAYLHVELAAFYEHVRKDSAKAKAVLVACQQNKSAAQQCKEQLESPLYLPSEYKEQIM